MDSGRRYDKMPTAGSFVGPEDAAERLGPNVFIQELGHEKIFERLIARVRGCQQTNVHLLMGGAADLIGIEPGINLADVFDNAEGHGFHPYSTVESELLTD